eukprot:CAMPEP_0114416756 /NCGR_PEP_ID=MMETSP0103-20121206/2599_1 /TAXON_ID=37642 ORGANISM="Paraphysomonas imperforata, Strain PA2" /NCGR_SAMPLE_ID=MMETSP0103 /ASSEMBLY_ACC=CAM_ASM_000201 /LENGTH=55 /DNA_ID=CAMNT_0001585001 /DNA_START=100 /DNA_END=267 /DNA_ORIENTATION=-
MDAPLPQSQLSSMVVPLDLPDEIEIDVWQMALMMRMQSEVPIGAMCANSSGLPWC